MRHWRRSRSRSRSRKEREREREELTEIIERADRALCHRELYLNPTLTLSLLAKEIGTNRSYLSASIGKIKGSSYSNYINEYRVEHSKRKIKESLKDSPKGIDNSKMEVEDYAIESGFGSSRTFIRHFKLREGITPTQYKNALLWRVRE